ncbi:hypothetical protein LXL04_012540 [Taraxacum kok-saghyz]
MTSEENRLLSVPVRPRQPRAPRRTLSSVKSGCIEEKATSYCYRMKSAGPEVSFFIPYCLLVSLTCMIEEKKNNRFRIRMGLYAEMHNKVEEHLRWSHRATVQLRGLYDAIYVRWLSRFFHYLDRYFITRRSLPALKEVGLTYFRDLVYQELHGKVRDAVIALIDQEREGEQIDRGLLKNILDIFVEIGMGQMEYYENDFKAFVLKDTSSYYSRKASNWILQDSCPDYMLKAEECLKREKDRVSHYLHFSSEPKLLEKVQNELLSIYATQLLEKEHFGCHALLKDDKVDDLSKMFRLFSKIPHGLDPVSTMFKQHVCAEGTALVNVVKNAILIVGSYDPKIPKRTASNI